ncbi:MAG: cysteine desulfhydrase [Magnetovibrio sp.]|nr:cysteine desulfhydrase [Magnetovibrio sp.]|tara:strand:+ start:22 stop:1053 length:1032 start_codon:yes stop_codon:yes gene_type:complete
MSEQIQASIAPRVRIAHTPTPIEPMSNLSIALGGPKLFVKRDDCTGLATGGNKVRQLEYYIGQAVASDADTIVITGAVQSNFVRQAAAAARKFNMDCHVQLEDRVPYYDDSYHGSGNVLLNRLLGATIHKFSDGKNEAAADTNLEAIASNLRNKGHKPYIIHLGIDYPPWGGLGYVDAGREIMAQADCMDIHFDYIVVASGSGLTHAGLLAGLRASGTPIPVIGICVRRDSSTQNVRVKRRLQEIISLAGLPTDSSSVDDVQTDDTWLGASYGLLTDQIVEAIHLAAQTEGLILDPVYTGKVMAGLIGMVRRGDFNKRDKVLFVHTGGAPALFGYEMLHKADT